MNYLIWADELNDFAARNVKSRYYGEITYIDTCIGRILDAVEAREDSENTLICFSSDHGDHLGDHHAWQKESYFEQSCHIPFLLLASRICRMEAGGRQEGKTACLSYRFIRNCNAGSRKPANQRWALYSECTGRKRKRAGNSLPAMDVRVPTIQKQ